MYAVIAVNNCIFMFYECHDLQVVIDTPSQEESFVCLLSRVECRVSSACLDALFCSLVLNPGISCCQAMVGVQKNKSPEKRRTLGLNISRLKRQYCICSRFLVFPHKSPFTCQRLATVQLQIARTVFVGQSFNLLKFCGNTRTEQCAKLRGAEIFP